MSAGVCPVCGETVGHVESQSTRSGPPSAYCLMPCGHEVDKDTASHVFDERGAVGVSGAIAFLLAIFLILGILWLLGVHVRVG